MMEPELEWVVRLHCRVRVSNCVFAVSSEPADECGYPDDDREEEDWEAVRRQGPEDLRRRLAALRQKQASNGIKPLVRFGPREDGP